MNILFYYSKTIDPIKGGIARITNFLGDYLEKNNHKVFYLSAIKEKGDNFIENKQLFLNQTNNLTIQEQHTIFNKIISENQIEILIHQSATTPSQNYIINWAKECNIKVISVFHSSLMGIYGVNGRKFTKHIPKILLPTLNSVSHLYFKYKYGRNYTNLTSKSDKIILLSDKFINELYYFAKIDDNDKIVSIPNPLTVKSSTNIKKENILLSVGRLSSSKQINLLLKVWERIHSKYPDWRLEIIGDGEERKKLEKESHNKKLTNIYFKGFQAPEEYYKKSKIFCMTSAHEGFGLVLVEGMANGVVPIAFNSYPNIVDIIDDNINGILIKPFSIDEYTNKIIELIENSDTLNYMSANSIIKSQSFMIENIGKMWLKVISNI